MQTLTTSRLSLTPVAATDLDAVHILHSLPEVDRYNTLGIPEHLGVTRKILWEFMANNNNKENQTNHTYKMERVGDGTFIGLIALNLGKPKFKSGEVWYKLHPDFWKEGYATEGLNAILGFGFKSLDLHRIAAGCAVDNVGSIRTLEKVGMIREGSRRQVLPLSTGWSDNYEYAILSSEFKMR